MLSGKTVTDLSDQKFTVEVVRVMSPNGKGHFISGDMVPVVWKTYGTSQPVASTLVQYSVNGGSSWKTVATLPGNPGLYEWNVPAAVASIGKCRVQVVLRAASGAIVGKDTSDANFNAGKVLVLAPNGGEVVASGGTVDIAWDAVAGRGELRSVLHAQRVEVSAASRRAGRDRHGMAGRVAGRCPGTCRNPR